MDSSRIRDFQLHRNWIFLTQKFQEIEPEIGKAKADGRTFVPCEQCRHEAAERKEEEPPLFSYSCWVCRRRTPFLDMECPECSKRLVVYEDARGECDCGFSACLDWLAEQLDDGFHKPSEEPFPDGIYCGECLALEQPSVIGFRGSYLCICCLVQHDSVDGCEWCSQTYAGKDMEGSMLGGCEVCDGRLGWRDD